MKPDILNEIDKALETHAPTNIVVVADNNVLSDVQDYLNKYDRVIIYNDVLIRRSLSVIEPTGYKVGVSDN